MCLDLVVILIFSRKTLNIKDKDYRNFGFSLYIIISATHRRLLGPKNYRFLTSFQSAKNYQ